MSKICPNCGREINDEEIKCPYCQYDIVNPEEKKNSEDNNKNVELQEPSGSGNDTKISSPNASVSSSSIIDFGPVTSVEKSEANETSDTTINSNNIMEEVSVSNLDDIEVDNINLETVSAQVVEQPVVEDEVVELPEMPEATIVDINPNALGNIYDEQERKNNELIAEKKRQDEEKRKQQEQQAAIPVSMEKPDLLAPSKTVEDDEKSKDQKKKKKASKKKLNIITIIIVLLIIIAFAIYYFISNNQTKNENYMEPVKTYFEGYREGNVTKMLSAFVPCLANSDELLNNITNMVNGIPSDFVLEYSEERTEVVNNNDQSQLGKFLADSCSDTEASTIVDYRHVYINEKIKTNDGVESKHPEMYVVKINDKWYILALEDSGD